MAAFGFRSVGLIRRDVWAGPRRVRAAAGLLVLGSARSDDSIRRFRLFQSPPMPRSAPRLTAEILYGHLNGLLERADALMGAPQCHGVLAGIACLSPEISPNWEHALYGDCEPGDVLVSECNDFIDALQSRIVEQLADPEFAFSPLLAGDDEPLDRRLDALVQWCEGLLFGVGVAGLPTESALPETVREFLRDVTEISRVDTWQLDPDDQADFQYFELIEYLRAGCSLLFEELGRGSVARSAGDPRDEAEYS